MAPQPPLTPEKQTFGFEAATEKDDIIRLLEPADTERLRQRFLTGRLQDEVAKCFVDFPDVQSMTLLVSQYWDDEALDAVHCQSVWSQLPTPDLDSAAAVKFDDETVDHINLGDRTQWWMRSDHDPVFTWSPNGYCISLFAAFCVEGGHQNGGMYEFSSPLAIYRRTGEKTVEMEFVGDMVRPWLDGVAFEDAQPTASFALAEFEAWVERG